MLFAALRDLAGSESLQIELQPMATLADLKQALLTARPEFTRWMPSLLCAVNGAYASDDTLLTEHSVVALIPPVSGGSAALPERPP